MTPTYLGFAIFTGCASAICVAPRWPKSARALALIPLACLFVWLYIWVSTEVAQDRSSYYDWYQEAAYRAADPESRDPLFTALLQSLPENLTTSQFGAILSALVFSLVLVVFYRLVALRIMASELIPFVMLALICDRQFLDLTLNSTRSSIAALVFLLGVLFRQLPIQLLLYSLAIGIHGRLALILLIAYLVAIWMRRTPRLLWCIVFLGVAAMSMRLLTGGVILPEIGALDVVLSATESEASGGVLASESVARGLKINTLLSISLAAQIALGILLPAFMVARQSGPRSSDLAPESARMHGTLISLALVSTAIAMLFFPELSLASRLFIVPLMILPVLMNERSVQLLAAVKVMLIAVILQQHLA